MRLDPHEMIRMLMMAALLAAGLLALTACTRPPEAPVQPAPLPRAAPGWGTIEHVRMCQDPDRRIDDLCAGIEARP